MTEYKCGSAKSCKYGDMCKPNYDISACSHYKAEEPQTNEEWFDGLSTEEKAKWFDGLIAYCFGVGHITETEKKKYKHIVADVEVWLKQPHMPKE